MTTYRTPRQLVEELPWLTMGSLRWQIAHADELGLAPALLRPTPRRLLIDVERYEQWLEARRQGEAA